MANIGAHPLDPASAIGQFRAQFPDTESIPLDPPVSGFADYTNFSDSEIEAFLAAASDSVFRALGLAMLSQANQAAQESRSIADHDLRIDVTKRAADLRAQAEYWFALADNADSGSEDAFLIVSTGTGGEFIPELSEPIWGRRYGWGRWA